MQCEHPTLKLEFTAVFQDEDTVVTHGLTNVNGPGVCNACINTFLHHQLPYQCLIHRSPTSAGQAPYLYVVYIRIHAGYPNAPCQLSKGIFSLPLGWLLFSIHEPQW